MTTITLGIDIAKKTFDVALLRDSKYRTKKFDNKTSGFKGLIKWLNKNKQGPTAIHVCMEATGAYWQELATYFVDLSCKVSVVNPAKIKFFGQSELSRNKTDKADAKLIAKYCLVMNSDLQNWQPPAKHIRELQSLVRRSESLQKSLIQEGNRLETCDAIVKKSCNSLISAITVELKSIKDTIKSHVAAHEDLQKKSDLLVTIPGVSHITVSWVLAFIGDPNLFENAKQLTAFVGLNPKHRQSGTSVNGQPHISKMGDSQLRKMLYMPAIVAKQYNPIIKDFCDRLLSAGKSKMVVICAAMRKLLSIIYGVLKNNQPFDPNWKLSTC